MTFIRTKMCARFTLFFLPLPRKSHSLPIQPQSQCHSKYGHTSKINSGCTKMKVNKSKKSHFLILLPSIHSIV